MRLASLTLTATFALAGCATGATAQPGPSFPSPPEAKDAAADGPRAAVDAGAPDADPGADADFEAALAKLRSGDPAAPTALDGFLLRHPRSGHRSIVVALLARLALARNDLEGARALLDREAATSPDADANLRFVAGLLESRRGQPARARQLLEPFVTAGPPALAGAGDGSRLELAAALARTAADSNEPQAALAWWSSYADAGRPHERAYARERAAAIAGRLSADEALRAWETGKQPLVRVAVGPKAAAALQARGDAAGARRIADELDRLRRAEGPEDATAWSGRGDPTRFGLAVPLSGRAHLLGGAVSRGAMMALGEAAARTQPGRGSPQLVLRNTQDDARGPAAAVAELAREEAVLGVVGTPDPRAADQLGRDGVPFLVLDDEPPGGGGTAFQLVHAPEARAAALAKRALAGGLRSFAVLAPDSPSGKRFGEAFKRAVTAGGGRIVADVAYVAGSTSFAKPVRDLQRAKFEALFVPEDADRLELVAPALASADLWPRPIAEVTSRGPRAPEGNPKARGIVLLSTARGVTAGLVERAGRYVQGALLAPGFFADAATPDAATGTFVSSFKALYGTSPGAAEAYAYDGVRVLQACVERGATTRDAVLRMLTSESFGGATGSLRFAPDHGRTDPPLIYEVAGDEIRALR